MPSQIKDGKSMLLMNSVTSQEPALPYLPTHLEKEYERAGIRAEVVLAVQQVIQRAHAGGALQQGGLHPMGKAEGRQVWASLSFRGVAVQHLHHCQAVNRRVCAWRDACQLVVHMYACCVHSRLGSCEHIYLTSIIVYCVLSDAEEGLSDPEMLKLKLDFMTEGTKDR